jgi:hypothetical protein
MWPIFGDSSEIYLNVNSHTRHHYCYKCLCSCRSKSKIDTIYSPLVGIIVSFPATSISSIIRERIRDGILAEELTQAMLRDLLYWSIFTDRMDMAKVLILHIRTRICAALSCVAILRNRARKVTTSDQSHRYKQQAMDFEIYATDCINACYSKSERKACELLIREQPLFGKITCMQVSFVFTCRFLINVICSWLFHHAVKNSSILIVSNKFSIVSGTINFRQRTVRFLECWDFHYLSSHSDCLLHVLCHIVMEKMYKKMN